MESREVFISYSRYDIDVVKGVKLVIEDNCGVKCWMDLNSIVSGSPQFAQDIVDGIDSCKVFLFMLSENSQKSEFALKELRYAEKSKKHVVLVNINNCKLIKTFSLLYGLTDIIAWTDAAQREKLLRDIRRWAQLLEGTEGEAVTEVPQTRKELTLADYVLRILGCKREASKSTTKPLIKFGCKRRITIGITVAGALLIVGIIALLLQEKKNIENIEIFNVNGVEFSMVYVKGGTFKMGNDSYDNERPVHNVTLNDYYIGQTEVTQALWVAVMGSNPSNWNGTNLPVENVSYVDVKTFIEKLNKETGRTFRLPTEAEWEYAARGGGNSRDYKYSGSDNIGSVAWYDGNSGDMTHPVARKQANNLGLYDMSGNVWEWCDDWYNAYPYSSQINPGGLRVVRGGSWSSSANRCRVSYRDNGAQGGHCIYFGFRIAL